MRKALAVLTVVVLLAVAASPGAYAGSLFATGTETGVSVTAPFYQAIPSEQFATGKLQFDAYYRDQLIWSYDGATGEYAGVYPIGMGAGNDVTLHFYPNIDTRNLAVEAVAVGEAELAQKLGYVYDKTSMHFQFKVMDGLYPIERDADGRFAGDVVLDDNVSEGSHVVRIYALVRDAKREDKAFLVIFHWASKTPGVGLVDELRFRTEHWPANTVAPTPDYLTDLLARAGNGGNGQVFSRLLTADRADADRAKAESQEHQRVLDANAALIQSQERISKVEGALASATNTNVATLAVLGQHEARLGQLETTANGHADAIDALTANQQTLANGVNANTQGVADLGARVGALENWVAQAAQPASQPAIILPAPALQTVHFRIAFVSGVNQSPTTVEVECASGIKPYRVMEYLKNGFPIGTVMDFRIRKSHGQWQTINFTVTAEMEGAVKVIPVQ